MNSSIDDETSSGPGELESQKLLELEILRLHPVEVCRSMARRLGMPENRDELIDILRDDDCAGTVVASRILTLLDDESVVSDVLELAISRQSQELMETLLAWPLGRQELANLCATDTPVRPMAVEALFTGVHNSAIRPWVYARIGEISRDRSNPLWSKAAFELFKWGRCSPDEIGLRLCSGPTPTWLEGGVYPCEPRPLRELHPLRGSATSKMRRQIRRNQESLNSILSAQKEALGQELEQRRMAQAGGRLPITGRNDLCPCESGKKYKKCCLSTHQNLSRLDPWAMSLETLAWRVKGLRGLPMQSPNASRLLQVINESSLGKLKPATGDDAEVRWAIALRLFECQELYRGVHCAVEALQLLNLQALELEVVLTLVCTMLKRLMPPSDKQIFDVGEAVYEMDGQTYRSISPKEGTDPSVEPLVELWIQVAQTIAREGKELHFYLLAEALLPLNGDEIYRAWEIILATKPGLSHLLAFVEPIYGFTERPGAHWDVGPELCLYLSSSLPGENDAAEALRDLFDIFGSLEIPPKPEYERREIAELREWFPHLTLVKELPEETISNWPVLQNLRSLALGLDSLCICPDREDEVTADSVGPLRLDLEKRKCLQLKGVELLASLAGDSAESVSRRLVANPDDLVLSFSPSRLFWFLPRQASLEQHLGVAAASGTLASEYALPLPLVCFLKERFVLVQEWREASIPLFVG